MNEGIDSPFSEAGFKTLKYQPDYPGFFGGLLHARGWLSPFFDWHNDEHQHSGLALSTPAEVFFASGWHAGLDHPIMRCVVRRRINDYAAAVALRATSWLKPDEGLVATAFNSNPARGIAVDDAAIRNLRSWRSGSGYCPRGRRRPAHRHRVGASISEG